MRVPIFRILLGFVLGLTASLAYGWLIQPVEYVETAPASLRIDYRTDYVIMVAEAYAGDGDLQVASVRLAALGSKPLDDIVSEAMTYAMEQNFRPGDVELLNRLVVDLRELSPTPEIALP